MSNIIFTQCFVSETQLQMLIKWKTCPGSGESTHGHRGRALCGMRGMKLLLRLEAEHSHQQSYSFGLQFQQL